MTASITVVKLSDQALPGHLPWETWRVLRTASVFVVDGGHHVEALAASGIPVSRLDPTDAPGAAASLLAAAEQSSSVVFVDDAGERSLAVVEALAASPEIAVEVLAHSAPSSGAGVVALVAVMDRLRSPGGCPWDAEQTHASLRRYLLEETYEVLDAIDSGDRQALREELGDLLLQVVFHARIAQEDPQTPWGIDEVAEGIVDKLVRRHPHVFAGVEVDDADDVAARWDRAKRAEKGRSSVLDGVPVSQPALALAEAYLGRAERGDAAVPLRVPANEGISVGVGSLTSDTELGDLLLGVVAAARARGWDAETALRGAALRYGEAVRRAESP